jgi:hypothetical protein
MEINSALPTPAGSPYAPVQMPEPRVSGPATDAQSAKGNPSSTTSAPAAQDKKQATPEGAAKAAFGGSVRLDNEDGTQVIKFMDSKDVLIYQIPPQGTLALVKAGTHLAQQVHTSA